MITPFASTATFKVFAILSRGQPLTPAPDLFVGDIDLTVEKRNSRLNDADSLISRQGWRRLLGATEDAVDLTPGRILENRVHFA
jgi:hypothetical protein